MLRLLHIAALVALGKQADEADRRTYRLGAVGVRSDGVVVSARNGSYFTTDDGKHTLVLGHAEARCVRKMDRGGFVYVARVRRDGEWALARPCRSCMTVMRSRGIRKVYYTVGRDEYGVVYV